MTGYTNPQTSKLELKPLSTMERIGPRVNEIEIEIGDIVGKFQTSKNHIPRRFIKQKVQFNSS